MRTLGDYRLTEEEIRSLHKADRPAVIRSIKQRREYSEMAALEMIEFNEYLIDLVETVTKP